MKSLFQSKVFWLAVLQGAFGIVVVVESQYPELGAIAIVKSFIDITLRMLTTDPVALTKTK